jgi:hypothetical protein
MHRLIMNPPKGMWVHHDDDNGLNNCRDNLCICTPQENARRHRRLKKTASQYIGVFRRKRVPLAEVLCPAAQHPVDLSDQVRDRLKAMAGTGHLSEFGFDTNQGLLGRLHVETPPAAAFEVPVEPEAVAQELQADVWLL